MPNKYCPIFKPIELVGDSWTLLIIKILLPGPLRYNEIRGKIPDINNRTLSSRLKSMISKGVIIKSARDCKPTICNYELSELGRGVGPILQSIEEFGNKFLC